MWLGMSIPLGTPWHGINESKSISSVTTKNNKNEKQYLTPKWTENWFGLVMERWFACGWLMLLLNNERNGISGKQNSCKESFGPQHLRFHPQPTAVLLIALKLVFWPPTHATCRQTLDEYLMLWMHENRSAELIKTKRLCNYIFHHMRRSKEWNWAGEETERQRRTHFC